MGKIDAFGIEFQKRQPVYQGGEILDGTINIQVKERLKINKVELTVEGATNVHW